MNETEAIFTIVFRNLNLSAWENLEPEAQIQMINEVGYLMKCKVLGMGKKQQLGKRLDILKNCVTGIYREKINQILKVDDEGDRWQDLAS